MAADDQDQGYVPLYQPGKQGQTQTGVQTQTTTQQTPAAQTQAAPPAKDPNDQGYVPLVAPKQTGGGQGGQGGQGVAPSGGLLSGFGIDLQGHSAWNPQGWNVTMPQSVQDFGNVAGNEAADYTIPSLRAEAEAARQRLGPVGSASADYAGSVLSPTNLLYAVPYAGPGLAGGLHAGVKSWEQGNDPTTIAEDTAVGAGAGYLGAGVAKAAPVVAPLAARMGVTAGGPFASQALTHSYFGHGDIAKELMGAAGNMGLLPGWNEFGKWVQGGTKNVISSPAVQQAIKSLVLGGVGTARQNAGPYDQWVPGQ